MAIGEEFTRRLMKDAGIGPGMSVLDIGCGAGDVSFDAAALVGLSGTVVGIDSNEAAIASASARTAAAGSAAPRFVVASLDDLPTYLGPFDAITCRRVLMYLPDPPATLSKLVTLLRPGGIVAFHEHDMAEPPNLLEMPAHARAQDLVRRTIEAEGVDMHMGFGLDGLVRGAGLMPIEIRMEAVVQTPSQPYPLEWLLEVMTGRMLAQGVISNEAELRLDETRAELQAERAKGTWIADLMFGAIARKPE